MMAHKWGGMTSFRGNGRAIVLRLRGKGIALRSVLQQALVFVKQHWLLAATLCGCGLHIGIQPALSQTISNAEHWVNESCPKSLGPSVWRMCVDRETAALKNSRGPDVSTLSP